MNFNLHLLGWYNFQLLASTVAREVFGQTAQSFLASKDGGKDGAFSGTWEPNKATKVSGRFVFQCKFISSPIGNLKLSDFSDEYIKIRKLVENKECDNYIIFTNAGVSGHVDSKIKQKITALGVTKVEIYGRDWINQVIAENKRLRMLVPRVYGLGDLSEIIDDRLYQQSATLLNELREELSKVVITRSYQMATKALEDHGFVLLVGEPAAGKTTIASLLALTALDQWHASTMKVENADLMIEHWNVNQKDQFFWIDDAFGATQHERSATLKWNHVIPKMRAMVRMGAKIVLTSRNYIYEEARSILKTSAFPLLQESQVVIDVHDLTTEEKKQILYNHIKLGDQPKKFKQDIKSHLRTIAELKEFLPETARRLGSQFFTKDLYISAWHLENFVVDQRAFFVDLLEKLDKNYLGGLALIYLNDGHLVSPINLTIKEKKALDKLDTSIGKCTNALMALKGTLVQLVIVNDQYIWKYKHPTIADAISDFIAKSPELIEIYLHGCEVEELLTNITCGQMYLKNAVVIQRGFYPLIIKRLKYFAKSKKNKSEVIKIWRAKRDVITFLSQRCSDEFIKLFLEKNPDFLNRMELSGQYIEISPEVKLLHRLHILGILPEKLRKELIAWITKLVESGENLHILKMKDIQKLFKKDELKRMTDLVLKDVAPNLSEIRERKQLQLSDQDDPESHMDSFSENLDILADIYPDELDLIDSISDQRKQLNAWIIERKDIRETIEPRQKLFDNSQILSVENERNIFDDVDL